MERHYGRSRRTVETADPFAAFPAFGRVFALVRIGAWENECTEVLTAQFVAQGFNSLGHL